MKLLSKKIKQLSIEYPQIDKLLKRGQRNLDRILDIQYEVEDLLRKKNFKAYNILNRLLDSCKDELSVLFESESLNPDIFQKIQVTIEGLFGSKEFECVTLFLDKHVNDQLDQLAPDFSHRNCLLNRKIEKNISINIPPEIIDIVTKGILKNAFEYTPDNGKIDISLKIIQGHPELIIKDYGIGFTKEKLQLIFEDYFNPPDSDDYSTKKPFDFNAGGKGFDLLRIKIFSERYHFKIWIDSNRCRFIPKEMDICPGDISLCPACSIPEDCFNSGGTTVRIQFSRMDH